MSCYFEEDGRCYKWNSEDCTKPCGARREDGVIMKAANSQIIRRIKFKRIERKYNEIRKNRGKNI